jgi:SAM-dependent methyltransferase
MADYVFGYDARELRRLEEQHRIWLPFTREHLQAANVQAGDVVLDLGCGPGFVSTELVRRGAGVLAVDRDQQSLDLLTIRCRDEKIEGIHIYPACDALNLPQFDSNPTVTYMRWLLCYLGGAKTETLLRDLPFVSGSRLLIHDYLNYRSARLEPSSNKMQSVIDAFFQRMADADIGFKLPSILERCGFDITWKRIVAMAIAPSDPEWSWPDHFFELHVPSMEDSEAFLGDWRKAAENPGALFYSWPVLQLVAAKR